MGKEHAVGWEDVFVGGIVDEVGPPDGEDERNENALNKILLVKRSCGECEFGMAEPYQCYPHMQYTTS